MPLRRIIAGTLGVNAPPADVNERIRDAEVRPNLLGVADLVRRTPIERRASAARRISRGTDTEALTELVRQENAARLADRDRPNVLNIQSDSFRTRGMTAVHAATESPRADRHLEILAGGRGQPQRDKETGRSAYAA